MMDKEMDWIMDIGITITNYLKKPLRSEDLQPPGPAVPAAGQQEPAQVPLAAVHQEQRGLQLGLRQRGRRAAVRLHRVRDHGQAAAQRRQVEQLERRLTSSRSV